MRAEMMCQYGAQCIHQNCGANPPGLLAQVGLEELEGWKAQKSSQQRCRHGQ